MRVVIRTGFGPVASDARESKSGSGRRGKGAAKARSAYVRQSRKNAYQSEITLITFGDSCYRRRALLAELEPVNGCRIYQETAGPACPALTGRAHGNDGL